MSSSLQDLRVMVIEDTMTQAMMIQHLLDKAGARATIARSAAKALIELEEQSKHPQLILCDVNMPEMNGFELCSKLKADPQLSKLPFVLLSTLVESTDLINVIECGADNFIYKTFEGSYFLQRLGLIWSTWNQENENDSLVEVTIFLDDGEKPVKISSQKLANLLVSSFETAVFHNRAQKSGG